MSSRLALRKIAGGSALATARPVITGLLILNLLYGSGLVALTAIAWCVLAGQVLRLAIMLIAAAVSTQAQPVDMGEGFSFTPWLAVLLLFVLAGVFAQGARMRADLEGTV